MVSLIDPGIRKLQSMLREMANGALRALEALESFRRGETRGELIRLSRDLKRLKEGIDDLALELIVRYQPVASDLRYIKSALEVSYDLYRISRYALDIAAALEDAGVSLEDCQDRDVREGFGKVKAMVKSSVEAFLARDAESAVRIREMDREIDEAYINYFKRVLSLRGDLRCLVSNLLIMRYLERIADHCVYMLDSTIFIVRGHRD